MHDLEVKNYCFEFTERTKTQQKFKKGQDREKGKNNEKKGEKFD